MKIKSFLIPALALALAGCANEELETIGSGTICLFQLRKFLFEHRILRADDIVQQQYRFDHRGCGRGADPCDGGEHGIEGKCE